MANPIGIAVLGLLTLIGLAIAFGGYRNWKRGRLMQDTATEKVNSATVGRTELEGTARPLGGTIEGPFSGRDCLVASYEIEQWNPKVEGPGSESWNTIERGTMVEPFEIEDDTGTMRVVPEEDAHYKFGGGEYTVEVTANEQPPERIEQFLDEHADVDPQGDRSGVLNSDTRRRYVEQSIRPGERVYLLGATQPVEDGGGKNTRLEFVADDATGEFIISTQDVERLEKWFSKGWRAIVFGLLLSSITLLIMLYQFGVI